ncbi:MAG TPA: alpha-hydroxy acid oxidase [Actinomycetaceae bacterium]|nr:alpha-hydroxy acid oxidase [Actinomycetaceae bacterium]
MIRWPRPGRNLLDTISSIADLRLLARRRTPRPIFDFVDGGAGDEVALRRNTHAFQRVSLVSRALRDVSTIDTTTEFFGRAASLPLALAPIGMTRIAHSDGEVGAARAAHRAGVPWVMPTMATTTPEEVAAHVGPTDRWFQLYLWRDTEASDALVRRAQDCGFTTLVLTIDTPVAGARLRDIRHGMTMPPSFPLSAVASIARHPRWWFDAITREPLENRVLPTTRGSFTERTNAVMNPSVTLATLERLREMWPGNILVKGILNGADAQEVLRHGADGVIVSNHGGRQLENAIAPLEALPAVREAVGPDVPVLVDGGIRSGIHIAIAIASGASGVLVGRAFVYGLMAGGQAGAERAIAILRADLERGMALLGATSLAELTPDLLHGSEVTGDRRASPARA